MAYFSSEQTKNAIKEGSILIDPYFPAFQGPNLYYCHLGNQFLLPKNTNRVYDSIRNSKDFFEKVITNKPIIIPAQSFLLAETFEFFSASNTHIIRLFNSSSLARMGISQCALGMINPGCGKYQPVRLTLELVNNAPFGIKLYPTVLKNNTVKQWGTEVLKVGIQEMDNSVKTGYSDWQQAVYHKDIEVTQSQARPQSNVDVKLPNDSQVIKFKNKEQ